jgi:hypothetical protein
MTHLVLSSSRRRRSSAAGPAVLAALIALTVLFAAACTAPIATPLPAPSSAPSPSVEPSVEPIPTAIDSGAAAAAAVLASDPRFAGLGARDSDLIGQCCWWTATPSATGFDVMIEIGWGDCPAGCINRHQWLYGVTRSGEIRLVSEVGPPVPAGIPGPGGGTTGGIIGIRGVATAGPVCPVVRPNDPNCADRPVVGAIVHVFDATGLEVATLETDATGSFVVTLPPGRYRVQGDPVEGLMGTAAPVDAEVAGKEVLVQLVYDTGIR